MIKGDEARAALVDAALQEASRIGLAALTLAPVAQRAGWSKSGLLRHFPTRESLQLAVLQRAEQLFRERVLLPSLAAPAGVPRLREIFRRWLSWVAKPGLEGGCPLNAARLEFDDRPGEVRDAVAAAWGQWMQYLERQAARAIDQREIRTGLTPRQLAMQIAGLVAAYDSALRLLGDRGAARDVERVFEQILSN